MSNFNQKTNLDYYSVLAIDKAQLCHDICDKFKIPTNGLVIIFDEHDYNQDDFYSQSIWINLGNHLNIQEGDGFDEISPPEIHNLIRSLDYSHLIWLSNHAWETEDIGFAWNLSHELCHFEQDLKNHYLSLAGNFLYKNLKGLYIEEPKLWITVPTELHAELTAWRTVKKLKKYFSSQNVNSYMSYLCNLDENKEHFQILTTHNPEDSYDVRASLISLLRKYQPELDAVINSIYGNTSILQNVDHICSELVKTSTALDRRS